MQIMNILSGEMAVHVGSIGGVFVLTFYRMIAMGYAFLRFLCTIYKCAERLTF
jgi:hypothetical protein